MDTAQRFLLLAYFLSGVAHGSIGFSRVVYLYEMFFLVVWAVMLYGSTYPVYV